MPMLGDYLPRYCGIRPFAGHWAFTDYFPAQSKFCAEVFAGHVSSDAVLVFFEDAAINYVLVRRGFGV